MQPYSSHISFVFAGVAIVLELCGVLGFDVFTLVGVFISFSYLVNSSLASISELLGELNRLIITEHGRLKLLLALVTFTLLIEDEEAVDEIEAVLEDEWLEPNILSCEVRLVSHR